MVAANAQCAVTFSLTPGNAGDAPEGRKLLHRIKDIPELWLCSVVMDGAYEGNKTRNLAFTLGFNPVTPPNPRRLQPWIIDTELYKKRNEIERLFRKLKDFRRIFTRYDKLDVMFIGYITFALIIKAIK